MQQNTASTGRMAVLAFPVALCGGLVGTLLPRELLLEHGKAAYRFTQEHADWSVLNRFIMFLNMALLLQQLWYRCTSPGTFRRWSQAVLEFCQGMGWHVAPSPSAQIESLSEAKDSLSSVDGRGDSEAWPVTNDDVQTFRDRAESDDPAHGKWDEILNKTIPGVLLYRASRRMTEIRKSEYKSVTYVPDATPQEMMDFYLCDKTRMTWDKMLTFTETLSRGDFANREMIVHWVRSFPFSFLSDRDYVIARRVFARDDVLYCMSKTAPFPGHNPGETVVCDNYRSMWSIESCPCPFDSGKPACKVTLLHLEDFKIPENLARFAVRHGMWGVVQKMVPTCRAFIDSRRARGIAPTATDPLAYGSPHASTTAALDTATTSLAATNAVQPAPRNRKVAALRWAAAVGVGAALIVLGKEHRSNRKAL